METTNIEFYLKFKIIIKIYDFRISDLIINTQIWQIKTWKITTTYIYININVDVCFWQIIWIMYKFIKIYRIKNLIWIILENTIIFI